MAEIRMKRVYDDAEDADGARVLIDRMWPRGVSKVSLGLAEWVKVVAPSNELRRWLHDGGDTELFKSRYREELAEGGDVTQAALQSLVDLAAAGPLTLLSASREDPALHAVVLAELVRAELGQQK